MKAQMHILSDKDLRLLVQWLEEEYGKKSPLNSVYALEGITTACRSRDDNAWYDQVKKLTDEGHRSGNLNKLVLLMAQYELGNWDECSRLINVSRWAISPKWPFLGTKSKRDQSKSSSSRRRYWNTCTLG